MDVAMHLFPLPQIRVTVEKSKHTVFTVKNIFKIFFTDAKKPAEKRACDVVKAGIIRRKRLVFSNYLNNPHNFEAFHGVHQDMSVGSTDCRRHEFCLCPHGQADARSTQICRRQRRGAGARLLTPCPGNRGL